MKKKICVLLIALCTATSLAACGDTKNEDTKTEDTKTEDTAEEDVSEVLSADTRIVSVGADDMDKYITLGEYMNLEVNKEIADVTDEDIELQIETTMSSSAEEVTDESQAVQEGDIVNINYEGTKDGVAFDGGTAEGYDLTIGSGSFIDGFEDGIIGMKKGETKDLNLTFPENYGNEELNGQAVVFKVTVNSIRRTPELTDEWVKANTESDSIDAYKESVRKELEESNATAAETTALNNAWNMVIEASEVKEYPQEDMDGAIAEYEKNLQYYADQQEMTADEFLEAQGMTQEEFDEQSQQYAEYMIKQNLVVQAIMDAEGINLTDEDSQAAADELVTNYSAESLADLVEQYGQETVSQTIASMRVSEFVMSNAKVTEAIATDDGKDGVIAE